MAVGAVTVAVSTVDEVVLQAVQFSAVIKSGNQNQGKNYVQTGEHKNRKKRNTVLIGGTYNSSPVINQQVLGKNKQGGEDCSY